MLILFWLLSSTIALESAAVENVELQKNRLVYFFIQVVFFVYKKFMFYMVYKKTSDVTEEEEKMLDQSLLKLI